MQIIKVFSCDPFTFLLVLVCLSLPPHLSHHVVFFYHQSLHGNGASCSWSYQCTSHCPFPCLTSSPYSSSCCSCPTPSHAHSSCPTCHSPSCPSSSPWSSPSCSRTINSLTSSPTGVCARCVSVWNIYKNMYAELKVLFDFMQGCAGQVTVGVLWCHVVCVAMHEVEQASWLCSGWKYCILHTLQCLLCSAYYFIK